MVYERVRATRGGGGGGEPRQRRPTAREGGRRDGRVVGFSDLDVLVPGERGREALRSVKERDQAAAQAIESSLGAVLDMEEAKQEHVLIRRYMPKRECTAPKRERRKDSARGQRRVFGWVWAKAFVPAAERMATMKAVEDMIRNSTLIDGITLVRPPPSASPPPRGTLHLLSCLWVAPLSYGVEASDEHAPHPTPACCPPSARSGLSRWRSSETILATLRPSW